MASHRSSPNSVLQWESAHGGERVPGAPGWWANCPWITEISILAPCWGSLTPHFLAARWGVTASADLSLGFLSSLMDFGEDFDLTRRFCQQILVLGRCWHATTGWGAAPELAAVSDVEQTPGEQSAGQREDRRHPKKPKLGCRDQYCSRG